MRDTNNIGKSIGSLFGVFPEKKTYMNSYEQTYKLNNHLRIIYVFYILHYKLSHIHHVSKLSIPNTLNSQFDFLNTK